MIGGFRWSTWASAVGWAAVLGVLTGIALQVVQSAPEPPHEPGPVAVSPTTRPTAVRGATRPKGDTPEGVTTIVPTTEHSYSVAEGDQPVTSSGAIAPTVAPTARRTSAPPATSAPAPAPPTNTGTPGTTATVIRPVPPTNTGTPGTT
jgi:hypothetical protein